MILTKVVGYVLAVVGIIGLAGATVPAIRTALPGISSLSSSVLTPVSLIFVVVGAALVYVSSGGAKTKKGTEVPIYEGKKVVGYRRI